MSASGTWYNELGSMMNLAVEGTSVTGTYHTSVGDADGIYQLVGSLDVDGDPSTKGQAIAWIVVWRNEAHGSSHSITAWSGQYQLIDGVEEIETLWLLTSEVQTNDDWASTQINKDFFTRVQPSQQAIVKAKKKRIPAHPI